VTGTYEPPTNAFEKGIPLIAFLILLIAILMVNNIKKIIAANTKENKKNLILITVSYFSFIFFTGCSWFINDRYVRMVLYIIPMILIIITIINLRKKYEV
jgi:hypothetical protein